MADRVIVDASVAVAVLLEESGTEAARRLTRGWASARAELFVPSHFWIEVTNVLMRRRGGTAAAAVEGLIVLDGLGAQTVEPDRPVLLLAIGAMERFGLSAYDAVYLALAQSTEARLATLDGRLAHAATETGIEVEPAGLGRLAEHHAPYAATVSGHPTWANSAVVGRHIAELRRQAMTQAADSLLSLGAPVADWDEMKEDIIRGATAESPTM